ncbi:hypothetical protein ACH40F_08315 [Streptomyces sp. NPDC020794]|uniref:hypothetical protein n=1 Tax=unclassified Streptomyces TaxID=2593676 RepID=UPI0036EAA914
MELHVALSMRHDAVEAYRLAHAYRDEVLAKDQATPLVVSRFDVAMEPAPEEEPVLTVGAIAEDGRPVALLFDKETRRKVAGWLTPAATSEVTVYRASHDSIGMGLYTTAAAAREHCEAEERRSWGAGQPPTFDWIEDEDDGVAEMTAWVGGEECATGYVVTPLEVASAYDEEADE